MASVSHEYWQLSIPKNVIGGTAKNHLAQAALRVSAFEQEIGAEALGLFENGLAGFSSSG